MRRIRSSLGLCLAAFLLLAGCSLVSVTLLIELDVEGTHRSTSSNIAVIAVDLTDDPDFEDNKDKIQSVDEVGFVFRATNNIAQAATGEIWLSLVEIPNATPESVRSGGAARRVLSGLVLPPAPGAIDIRYEESLNLQDEANRAFLHDAVEGGRFYLYGIADTSNFDLTIDQLTVVVVLTAGE